LITITREVSSTRPENRRRPRNRPVHQSGPGRRSIQVEGALGAVQDAFPEPDLSPPAVPLRLAGKGVIPKVARAAFPRRDGAAHAVITRVQPVPSLQWQTHDVLDLASRHPDAK